MASDLYAPGSLTCANCGKPSNATVLVGKAQERAVCDDCMAQAADWKPPRDPAVKDF